MDPSSLVIDPQSPVPIYYQAALQIRDLILKGALVQDEKLPTEHELAAALDSLTGRATPDDIINAVFARFCVGK